MEQKHAAEALLEPGAAALEASRASQQDVGARQGDAEEVSFTPVAILLTILTPPTNWQHRNRPINRSPLSSNISERLDLESPYMLSHCIASGH